LQEYSFRFFDETYEHMRTAGHKYKSIVHSNRSLAQLSFNNFILAYSNLIDCLLQRNLSTLKEFVEGNQSYSLSFSLSLSHCSITTFYFIIRNEDVSNWRALKCISSFAYFWSFGSFLCVEDMDEFNHVAVDILTKNACELPSVNSFKLYESEIDIKSNSLRQYVRSVSNGSAKNTMISDVSYSLLIKTNLSGWFIS